MDMKQFSFDLVQFMSTNMNLFSKNSEAGPVVNDHGSWCSAVVSVAQKNLSRTE